MASVNKNFEQLVELNYQLYNGLFLTLPLEAVEHTGQLLPLLQIDCEKGLEDGLNPEQIINQFFSHHRPGLDEAERTNFLFKIIQYVERQVVLLDALDDAAYSEVHQAGEGNVLQGLLRSTQRRNRDANLTELVEKFRVRVTLTAHPTQFYPGTVLAIISDLAAAIGEGNTPAAKDLLQQLGNTRFFKKEQPSPYDEAILLSWYLSNIFYPSISKLHDHLARDFPELAAKNPEFLSVGFWPGGDRDGNPFVTVDITEKVAAKLRFLIVNCYHGEIRQLKRRLSFAGVYDKLEALEQGLYRELSQQDLPNSELLSVEVLLSELDIIETLLIERHQSLYLELLQSFQRKVRAFGFHFASLDIRQDSRVIAKSMEWLASAGGSPELSSLSFQENLDSGEDLKEHLDTLLPPPRTGGKIDIAGCDDVVRDTLESVQALPKIQARNGELACHRYIISNCQSAIDVCRVLAMFYVMNPDVEFAKAKLDVVPLFETVNDLAAAATVMTTLYENDFYRAHLQQRGNRQTVMVGFSDGTKDGGYLMANWAILKAKEAITTVSRAANIEVAFFDGRGGPPARGGGHTHKFYSALGKGVESNTIELTVQGQTVSSYYGNSKAALHNLRQLITAGLENQLYAVERPDLSLEQRELLDHLAMISYQSYEKFKAHPLFMPYLENMSTLKYYGKTNIGSRPTKRGGAGALKFSDLRAIPFVGAWAQLKQNVPGFYGLGSAFAALEKEGRFPECQELYRSSAFLQALVNNSMQSMLKTNFKLTAYMAKDETYGEFWQLIHDEFELSKRMLLKLSGQKVLLEENTASRLGIDLRQKVVLPLLVIQQYALMKIQQLEKSDSADGEAEALASYEKLVIRSLFGNINASRNSA